MRISLRLALAASVSALACIAASAQAETPDQPPATPAATGASGDRAIQEIIVTARRSSESLMKVPVSVTAMSGPVLARYNSSDLTRVAQMVPQVSLESGGEGGGGTFIIRGIGSTADEPGIEQSVGVIIDGTPVGRPRILTDAMFDTAQVEILKGPQALFFGKNSPAGVISVSSVDPVIGKFDGYARVGYEFRAQERYAEGAISIPLTPTLAVRLAGRVDQMAGWVKTTLAPALDPNSAITGVNAILPGGNYMGPDEHTAAARVTVLWQPTPDFKSKLKASYSSYSDNGSQFETVCPGQAHPYSEATGQIATANDCLLNRQRHATSMPAVYGTGLDNQWASGIGFDWVHSFVGSWTNDYDFGDGLKASAITGYYYLARDGFNNSNGSVFSEYSGGTTERTQNISQEVRLTSDFKGPINFMLGGYYEHNTRSQTSDIRLFPLSPDTRTGSYQTAFGFAHQNAHALSLFGQLRWSILDNLELSGGARWSRETKSVYMDNSFVSNGLIPEPYGPGGSIIDVPLAELALAPEGELLYRSFRGDNVSPEVTLTWHPTPLQTLYGAFKTGYKSGAISNPVVLTAANVTDLLVVQPEKVRGGEIGYKAQLLDRTVRVELTGYYYKFSSLQLSAFNSQTSSYFLLNAADATQKGIEAQVEWRATRELTLRAAGGYNDNTFGSFLNGACYAYQTTQEGCVNGVQDLSGRRLFRAPKWSATFGASYDFEVANGYKLGLNTDARFTSGYYQQENYNPASYQGAYWLLNAGVRFYPDSEKWELAFIGRNLTNTTYMTYSSDAPGSGPGTIEALASRGAELTVQGTIHFR
jgi:iron complex outermembrane recepter protein